MMVICELRRKKREPLKFEVHGQTTAAHDAFMRELRQLLKKHSYGGRLAYAITPPKRRTVKRKRKR
jgi:hypothetical protein